MIDYLKEKILEAVPDAEVRVTDPEGDGQHFEAVVISPFFKDMPQVRRHRHVLQALKKDFAEGLHALQLRTLTPEEAHNENQTNRLRKEIG